MADSKFIVTPTEKVGSYPKDGKGDPGSVYNGEPGDKWAKRTPSPNQLPEKTYDRI